MIPGLCYPLWRLLTPVGAIDPWWAWGSIGACFGLAGLLHAAGTLSRKATLDLVPLLAGLVTAHFFFLATANDMMPFYAVGSTMAGMAPVLFIRSRRAMTAYSLLVFSMSVGSYLVAPDLRKLAYWGSLVPVVALGYYQLERRAAQRRALEAAVEDRTRDLEQANRRLRDEMNERARLEEELRAHHKMEAVGRFAGGIAHDFNNLLSTISVYSDLLARGLDAGDPLQSEVAHIQRATRQAASITQQLLMVGRRSHAPQVVLDLDEVIADAETMLRHLIGEDKGLRFRYGEGPHLVRGDLDQLHQIVINLATNARDAMEAGGRFEMETSRWRASELSTVAAAEELRGEDYVRLSVRDTGHGMTAETVRRAFEPFFSTKAPERGSGLGLAIVHGIVSQAGGFIRVSSEPGRGSRFDLYWPRAQGCVASPSPAGPRRLREGRERVLLVEDDRALRGGLALVLRTSGYEVIEAGGGRQALELLLDAERPVDLLLSDVVMEGMSGFELTSRVRRASPGTRVLLISGHLGEQVLGARDQPGPLLAKPFGASRLLEKVRELLDAEESVAREGSRDGVRRRVGQAG